MDQPNLSDNAWPFGVSWHVRPSHPIRVFIHLETKETIKTLPYIPVSIKLINIKAGGKTKPVLKHKPRYRRRDLGTPCSRGKAWFDIGRKRVWTPFQKFPLLVIFHEEEIAIAATDLLRGLLAEGVQGQKTYHRHEDGLASTPRIFPIALANYPFTKIPTNSFIMKTPSKLLVHMKRRWAKKVSGKWSYFRSITKSWIGDWNVKQSVAYHVVQIECHPRLWRRRLSLLRNWQKHHVYGKERTLFRRRHELFHAL